MTFDKKAEILNEIFNITNISNQRIKDKIEGIIIGASLREYPQIILKKEEMPEYKSV